MGGIFRLVGYFFERIHLMQILRRLSSLLLGVSLATMVGVATLTGSPLAQAKQVKVFLLMGQSNMFGLGHVVPPTSKITLSYAVQKDHLYPFLVNKSGSWAVFNNIRFVHVMPGRGNTPVKSKWDAFWKTHSVNGSIPKNMIRILYNQWLSVKGHRFIGPEFGIAHEIAKTVHGPILLLKSCIGNRSIGWDLLPPGSKNEFYTDKNGKVWEYAAYGQTPNKWIKGTPASERKPVRWYAGFEYDMDTKFAQYVLAHLDTFCPGATSYKIMGIFFWQGDKDRYDAGLATHYEKNLTAFIHAVRKTFGVPKAPFVQATLGQDIKGVTKGNDGLVLKGQLDVANPALHPEFKGNVATVYAHPLSLGGASNGHYNGNAQTYMNVGLAMGKAMNKLLENK